MFEEFCFSLHSVQALWLWHTKIGLSVFLGRHVLKLIGLFFSLHYWACYCLVVIGMKI